MSLLALIPFLAVTAVGCAGIAYGLAMSRGRIQSLYAERNELWLRTSRQELMIDRLLRRQPQPEMTTDANRANRSI